MVDADDVDVTVQDQAWALTSSRQSRDKVGTRGVLRVRANRDPAGSEE
jgi:hypothetical protein